MADASTKLWKGDFVIRTLLVAFDTAVKAEAQHNRKAPLRRKV